jgi:CBS domain-containing protein
MSAGRICSRTVITAWPYESIRLAARRMKHHGVGTLAVLEHQGARRVSGIVTDRDIALRAVAEKLDLDHTPVSAIMTTPVRAVDAEMPIEHAIKRMAEAAARRLVVTGTDGELVGILSLDDVLDLVIGELAPIGRLLDEQAPHAPA